MAKQRVTLEVLSYHATAPAQEAAKLKVRKFVCISFLFSSLLASTLIERWMVHYVT